MRFHSRQVVRMQAAVAVRRAGDRLLVAALSLVFCMLSLAPASGQADTRRPNIVLMMADDMGMGDTSAYQDFTGNSDADQVFTPNMERLARMGVRFTDAHTPASRCSPTRYGLLTGRYPWRNRLKHWVLFGSQGDPMIEADRPTLGTLLQQHGYRTALVGKWHVGLRYRRSDGGPADGWDDADLTQPMFDTPLDHGFDYCRFTSRSHGTSGPSPGSKQKGKRNGPDQSVGPGHIHGRTIVAATGNGKQLESKGENAYVLSRLGGRHLRHAVEFLRDHLSGSITSDRPFFLYYPSNSNHGPYTPDDEIQGKAVAGAARSVAGNPMDVRYDFIYENDVVLGHLIDFLEATDDPRNRGKKLIDNTIILFTSDNGAEKADKRATGPFRSNKGSTYEGGHRVPFIVSWRAGRVGDGDATSEGRSDASLVGLQDMFATFADVIGAELPDLRKGQKGGEDSSSVLSAWRGERAIQRPILFHDHKEAEDPAVMAMRLDDPVIDGQTTSGQWKLLFDAGMLRLGIANPTELYELSSDPKEATNLIAEARHRRLIESLAAFAQSHRTVGGHRLTPLVTDRRIRLSWNQQPLGDDAGVVTFDLRKRFAGADPSGVEIELETEAAPGLRATVTAVRADGSAAERFHLNGRGLGIEGGEFGQVDKGEALLIQFNQDVLVESAAIIAGNGVCGGFYRVGDAAPLAIYCVDADLDAKDQSGLLSDVGVLPAGKSLRLDSSPHFGVETPGRWRLGQLTLRRLASP